MHPVADPPISQILKAHGLDAAHSNWRMPLDVADPSLPQDFAQTFIQGYTKSDPWLIHRALKLWKEHAWRKNRHDHEAGVPLSERDPEYRFFAIPGYGSSISGSLKSLADLDDDDGARVSMVQSAVLAWGFDLCFARLSLTWYGPRDRSPGRASNQNDGNMNQTVLAGLGSRAGIDYDLGIAALYGTGGNAILPPFEGPSGQQRLRSIMAKESAFMQPDFFSLQPDGEEAKPQGVGKDVWVRQAWARDVSVLVCHEIQLPCSLRSRPSF